MAIDDEEEPAPRARPHVETHDLPRDLAPGALGYYKPRKIDGLWRYTMRAQGAGGRQRWYAVGYCRDPEKCAGHRDAASARAHFRDYLLAEQTRLMVKRYDPKPRWRICQAAECRVLRRKRQALALWLAARWSWAGEKVAERWGLVTLHTAIVVGGVWMYDLCLHHQYRGEVEKLLPEDIGEMMG